MCAEKDARIKDLQSQIETLRALVSPPTNASRIPVLQVEADAVLSGHDEAIHLNSAQQAEYERISSEASRILNGNY